MSTIDQFKVFLGMERRLLWRHGVIAAVGVVAVSWIALLHTLPRGLAIEVLPLVLYIDAAIVGVLFIGAAVLIERRQGSLEALTVSAARSVSYLAAKVSSFTLLALGATLAIALALDLTVRPWLVALAVLLSSPMVLLAAIVVVARADTITAYLFRVQAPLAPAMLPLMALAGWVPWEIAWLSPTTGAFRLLQAACGGPVLRGWEWLLAITMVMAMTTLIWVLALRRVQREMLRAGRLT